MLDTHLGDLNVHAQLVSCQMVHGIGQATDVVSDDETTGIL